MEGAAVMAMRIKGLKMMSALASLLAKRTLKLAATHGALLF
jgi:hypothetical protein